MTTARDRILDVLDRAAAWLTTGAVAVRCGLHERVAARTLRALHTDGHLDRRDDPENNRVAQWRPRGPWVE